ncbi:amidohydrolase family protein [Roseivivax isoporae]|uniref:S-adenosylhomocysteine deaminase n=1 Tax=Roseivivax isoporae LMG 25204 TaxID=1449351 RepID=X7F6H9_9RHOB|nr:amidohydrolase family protein [Roseivivax isoporae]ETX27696.1 S-adenosylhomocysteine deaminase [Roseivivax isoporae LMG 25204]
MTGLPELTRRRSYALAPDLVLTPAGARDGMVVQVRENRIAFVGPRAEFERQAQGTPITDMPDRAIVPGFIDAHTHLGQAFGKAITGGEPAQIWRRIWAPMESSYDADTVHVSAKWMFLEALRGGFTGIVNFAVLDGEKAAALHQAAEDVGIRLVSATGGALPVDGPHRPTACETAKAIDAALRRAEAHIDACAGQPLITPSLCIPAVQSAPVEMIRALSDYAAERGVLFQIHTNEHHVEVHWSVCTYGRRPLEVFAEHGAVGPHTLHHHCTLVTDHEIEILRETGSAVSYNPLASAWKGDRVAPALGFAARGVRFGIGTDSTRSDALRLLESAETAQRLSQGMQNADFSCGAAWTWIDGATRGSADAAGLAGVTGQIVAGQRADFLVLDRRQPEVTPSWDFEWELVRLYNRDQIDAVVVDGRCIMEGSRPVGWDSEEFLKSNRKRAQDAVSAAPIIRCHGRSADFRYR